MESQRRIVMGPTGCGKTTLVKKWIAEISGRYVFVADPHINYICSQRFFTGEQMQDYFMIGLEKNTLKPGVYCATFSNDADWDAFFLLVAAICGAAEVPACEYKPSLLVVDELADFSDGRSTMDSLLHFIRYGRHSGLWLYYCSMQGRNINRLLLSNAATIVCFRLPEEDLDHLKKCVSIAGADFDRCRELSTFTKAEYPNVQEGRHYLIFGEGQKEVMKNGERREPVGRTRGDGQGLHVEPEEAITSGEEKNT